LKSQEPNTPVNPVEEKDTPSEVERNSAVPFVKAQGKEDCLNAVKHVEAQGMYPLTQTRDNANVLY